MKKSKFTESQITNALREHEAGKRAEDICHQLGISRNTLFLWKKKYGGMDAQMLRRYKELEQENARLKRMYADLSVDHDILKYVVEKKL